MITISEAASLLRNHDKILLLAHIHPDGDTLGSCFALCHALQDIGKRARVKCWHDIPPVYGYMLDGLVEDDFEPEYVVTVDVADLPLLGGGAEVYGGRIDLCIDHHAKSRVIAENNYVRADAAACAEIIYDIIEQLSTTLTPVIAACLYTGIATDTGCFRFSNTTAYTHAVTAKLMELDYDFSEINRLMFDSKTPQRIALEAAVLNNMEYYFDGRCAVSVITLDELHKTGAVEADLDGINALPRTVNGVVIGITVRETSKGVFKVSVRTFAPYDATEICSLFGGGGHIRAGGCTVKAESAETARDMLVKAAGELLEKTK